VSNYRATIHDVSCDKCVSRIQLALARALDLNMISVQHDYKMRLAHFYFNSGSLIDRQILDATLEQASTGTPHKYTLLDLTEI